MKRVMITECKQPNVDGYNQMEFGDRINWWCGFISVKYLQRLFILVRTGVRAEEATYVVRSYIYVVILQSSVVT